MTQPMTQPTTTAEQQRTESLLPVSIHHVEGKDVPLADSRAIAQGCGIEHKNALELLSRHRSSIESEFGQIAFKTESLISKDLRQMAGKKPLFALLTEDQATALICLMRNKPIVVRFKVSLVKAFGEARRELERKGAFNLPRSLPEALRALADAEEAKAMLQLQNSVLTPKAEFYDAVTGSDDLLDMAAAVKVLNLPFGRNRAFARLRDLGILRKNNTPYQEHIDAGRFRVTETKWSKPNGEIHITLVTHVTQIGLDYLRKKLGGTNIHIINEEDSAQ